MKISRWEASFRLTELFEKPRKLRAHLTRAENRRHNQQWTRLGGSTTTTQLKEEQEEDPEVQRWMTREDPTCIKQSVVFVNNGFQIIR